MELAIVAPPLAQPPPPPTGLPRMAAELAERAARLVARDGGAAERAESMAEMVATPLFAFLRPGASGPQPEYYRAYLAWLRSTPVEVPAVSN